MKKNQINKLIERKNGDEANEANTQNILWRQVEQQLPIFKIDAFISCWCSCARKKYKIARALYFIGEANAFTMCVEEFECYLVDLSMDLAIYSIKIFSADISTVLEMLSSKINHRLNERD